MQPDRARGITRPCPLRLRPVHCSHTYQSGDCSRLPPSRHLLPLTEAVVMTMTESPLIVLEPWMWRAALVVVPILALDGVLLCVNARLSRRSRRP